MMRRALFSLLLAWMITAVPAHAAPSTRQAAVGVQTSSVVALSMEQWPDKKIDITVQTQSGGGGYRWYRNPVWIAIGGLGAIVVLLLIVLMARGSDTTVIKQ